MKQTRSTLVLCLNLLMVIASSAASRFYDAEQLSSNLITGICQDRQGYIWIGTEYGLNKFDGVRFTSYFADDDVAQPLLNNHCRKVLTDKGGQLWVTSYKGVQRYDRLANSFPTVTLKDDMHSFTTDMIKMNDDRLLILTIKSGLFLVDTVKMVAEPWKAANDIYTDETASNVFEDCRGRLWISSDRNGVTMLDLSRRQSVNFGYNELGSHGVNAVSEDQKGRIVVLSRTNAFLLDEHTMTLRSISSGMGISPRNLFRTRQRRVLVSTYGNGMFEVDGDNGRLIPVLQQEVEGVSLRSQFVQGYLEDAQQNQWIACHREGIAFLEHRQQPFSYFNLQSLPHSNGGMLTLLAHDGGHFMIGQEKNGIIECTIDGGVISHTLPDQYVIAYNRSAPEAEAWIGTYTHGASILRNGSSIPVLKDSLRWKRIKDIVTDKSGRTYLAAFDYGLITFPELDTPLSLVNRFLNKLFIDSEEWLWIGHYGGVDVYDTRNNRRIDIHADSLLSNASTHAIMETADGLVWVGTNKGLFRYDRQKRSWSHYDKRDGLCNEIVCGLVSDKNGDLWISTYRGLSHLLRQTGKFVNYYKGNGLVTNRYVRGIYGKSDDYIFFGNDHGFTYFPTTQNLNNDFQNGITLTGLFVAGKEIGTDGEHIDLAPEDNTFTLCFSTMDFRETSSVHYEYLFSDEHDEVWHQLPPGVSELILSKLSYGTHILKVRAQDGGSFSPVKQLTIHITPPWYRSWWAYTLYALILIAVAAFVLLYIRQRQQAQNNEDKIKFFVDISHELRSPLTLIKSPLDQLLKSSHDPATTRALLNIKRNTNRLLTLMNQILSIRKIEKGQMTLRFAETLLGDFISDICHDYDYMVEKRQLTLTFDNQAPDMKVWIDTDQFDKVVANLLSNAIKYVDNGGTIVATLRKTDDNQAELTVSDDGPGIDEAQLRKIFERFYQASAQPAAGQMSYGIGLNLTQKIVGMHHGTITARNRTDESHGSVFIVRLPLGCSHLPKEQLELEERPEHTATQERPSITRNTAAVQLKRVRVKTSFHVAVVDDDEEIRQFLQTELGESYHVHVFADPTKALEDIIDSQPDLVISDVVMPQMNGFELLRRLKQNTRTIHIPVILLTTKADHQSRIAGLDQGADAYIDKPFDMEELEAVIAGLIANRNRLRGKFTGIQEQTEGIRQIELKGNDAVLMEKIVKAVNKRLDDSDFNVEALSEEVGLSRVQLHRRMKELTGISVGEFIRNIRLEQAAKLLTDGDHNISQVTYAVGFSSPNYFSAAFKKHFGVNPSEYAAKHQEDRK